MRGNQHAKKKPSIPKVALERAARVKRVTSDNAKKRPESLDEWTARLKTDAPALIAKEMNGSIRRLVVRYRKSLYLELAKAISFGDLLKSSKSKWSMFCDLDVWENVKKAPKLADIADACRFCIKLTCGLDDDGNKNASFYFAALNRFLTDNGRAEEVVEYVENAGGLSKLAAIGRAGTAELFDDGDEPLFGQGSRRQKVAGKSALSEAGRKSRTNSKQGKDWDDNAVFITLRTGSLSDDFSALKEGAKVRLKVEILSLAEDGAAMDLIEVKTLG